MRRSATNGLTRFDSADIDPSKAVDLRADHPALSEGRTIFRDSVHTALETERLLVSGHNNPKLGKAVMKGPRKGWPIYQLTLEERATCPRDCPVWAGCYGNAMPYARRHGVDATFRWALWMEVNRLCAKHPKGLLIRLHTLGDFYSVEYVLLWAELLARNPNLHVFGYTARRIDGADHETRQIARAIALLTGAMWDRFAIRTSHAEFGPERSVVVEADPEQPGVIVCPAQTKASEACATCGLCWASSARDKTIAFLRHGMSRNRGERVRKKPEGVEAGKAPLEGSPIKATLDAVVALLDGRSEAVLTARAIATEAQVSAVSVVDHLARLSAGGYLHKGVARPRIGTVWSLGPKLATEPEAAPSSALALADPETCKWPIGDPREPDFHYCGGARVDGKPYCADHLKAAHLPTKKRAA